MPTADKIIWITQDPAMFTKKEKEIFEVKHKRNVSFQKARKIVGTCIGENLCWTEDGYNPSRQQIKNTRGEIDSVGSE